MYMLIIEGAGEAQGGGLNPFDPAGFGGMLWTWVIFLASLPLMWKVVMGPITKALEARDEQASRAILEAEQAREEAGRARTEVESKLAEARAEAAKLLAEARERASAVERQITDEANARTQRMVAEATATIQTERDKALATIREEVVDLSMAGARVVLGRNVGSDDDRRMVSDMVGKLKVAKK
ncbi:MAG: F0F1 ATP synthase subunit B [Planctomycetes bacterium]|nr:F0F1 ATP synthase subunit B [Planctomycetota bacterium]